MGVVIPLDDMRDPAQSLKPLLGLVAEDMQGVNRIILDKAVSDVDLIPKLAHHLIDSGGKRLRPMLALATARLCGYKDAEHIVLAASIEFLHTATLLHDDVVDESDIRRGKKSARILWDNQSSVLVGDFLLGQAFRMMVTTGSLPSLQILSNAAAIIAEGEIMQLAAAKNVTTSEDTYLAIINSKTAALFSAAAEVGGAIADEPDEVREALRSYGKNLGIAFQLVDDALDYSGEDAKLGKNIGDDFQEGKITLPVILSWRRGNAKERAFWKRTLTDSDIQDGDLEHAIELMGKHKAIDATFERARHYGAIACDALAIFPQSKHKAALLEVVGFCISRAN